MKTVRCPQCNLVCWNTVLFCNRCGFDMQSIIEQEPPAEFEPAGSFGQNVEGHFAQNTSAFKTENSQNFSENPNGYQSQNRNSFNEDRSFEGNDNRTSGQNYGNVNNGNYHQQNRFQQNTHKTKKGLAITSLVLGIIGFPPVGMTISGLIGIVLGIIFGGVGFALGFSLVLLIPVVALITGIVAIRRTNKNPTEFGGKGLAIGGICCSAFGLLVFPIIGAIAIPNLLAARRAANEGSAISTLRTLASAETTLRETKGVACADLKQLGGEGLIDTVLAKGEKSGYRFVIAELPTLQNDCAITATPSSELNGDRAFYYSTEDGEIRAKKYAGKMADMYDEPIE